MKALDVDKVWITQRMQELQEVGAATLGIVVAYRGCKILIGRSPEGQFQATAEYETRGGKARTINVVEIDAEQALLTCFDRLQSLGVRAVPT